MPHHTWKRHHGCVVLHTALMIACTSSPCNPRTTQYRVQGISTNPWASSSPMPGTHSAQGQAPLGSVRHLGAGPYSWPTMPWHHLPRDHYRMAERVVCQL